LKICLLISGHLRTFKQCLPTIKKNLINELGCDVFLHTWSKIESNTNSWHSHHMKDRDVTEEDILFIKNTINPKNIIVEEQTFYGFNKNLYKTNISLDGLKNMTYGFKRAYKSMKKYEVLYGTYDLIVKIRPDIFLLEKFSKDLLNIPKQSILFFGNPAPIIEHTGNKEYYHQFRALDILSVCSNDKASYGIYGLFDNFDDYYMRQKWHHTPYLDFVLEQKIKFQISHQFIYGNSWFIKRGN